jgi:adenylate kinase
MVNFLIFGPPGSGKGTQSIKLAEKFNLKHLSTGDMLREEVGSASDIGKKVESIMKNGELVPDEIVIEMIAGRVDNTPDIGGFIFDGFPRTVDQAMALDKMLKSRDSEICRMLVLEVEHKELVGRLTARAEISGRADDQEVDVIENRVAVYKEKTEPVINYFSGQGKFISVNGMGQISEIFERLSAELDNYL